MKKKVTKPHQQKNIVSSPVDGMQQLRIELWIDEKKTEFIFWTNIKEDEIGAVIDNWQARYDELTVETLIEYINSKSHYGFKASKEYSDYSKN